MIRRPPRSTRTDTLFPYTTLFRSVDKAGAAAYERIIRPAQYRWPGWIVRCRTQAEGAIAALANEPWPDGGPLDQARSEEHTSELQSLMRISYAVFCLKKKKTKRNQHGQVSITQPVSTRCHNQ